MIKKIKIFFCLLFISVLLNPGYSVSQWKQGSVDTLTHDNLLDFVRPPNSIAVDIDNTVYVVWDKFENYSQDNKSKVFISQKAENGKWSEPLPISDTMKLCFSPTIIASKKTRKIYVVYNERNDVNSNGKIILAEKDEGNIWSKINISSDSLFNALPALELDSMDKIHVAWVQYISGNNRIKYSNNVSGNWNTSTLIDNYMGDNNTTRPSLAVTQKGIAHITYTSYFHNSYKNIDAENSVPGGDQWKYELLPESVSTPGILKVDNNDVLHFICSMSDGFQYPVKVFYTNKVGENTGWSNPEIINNEFDGYCSSFEIGNDNKLYLSVDSLQMAFGVGKSYIATNKSGEWNFYPAILSGNIQETNLKIDNNGIGHIIGQIFKSINDRYEIVHYESSNNIVGISSNTSKIISNFELYQNYPNPFNPVTSLEFHIPKSGFVTLKIYDLPGKEVLAIVNESLNPGTYKYEFDGSNFPSGVYFYKLVSGNYTSVRRMVLLK